MYTGTRTKRAETITLSEGLHRFHGSITAYHTTMVAVCFTRHNNAKRVPPASMQLSSIAALHFALALKQCFRRLFQVDTLDRRAFASRANLLRQAVLCVYRMIAVSLFALLLIVAHCGGKALMWQVGPDLYKVSGVRCSCKRCRFSCIVHFL